MDRLLSNAEKNKLTSQDRSVYNTKFVGLNYLFFIPVDRKFIGMHTSKQNWGRGGVGWGGVGRSGEFD